MKHYTNLINVMNLAFFTVLPPPLFAVLFRNVASPVFSIPYDSVIP